MNNDNDEEKSKKMIYLQRINDAVSFGVGVRKWH